MASALEPPEETLAALALFLPGALLSLGCIVDSFSSL